MRASAIVGALVLLSCGVAPTEELLSSPNVIEPAPEPATGPRFFGDFKITHNLDPLNGIASTKILEPLVARELSYNIAFEIVRERTLDDSLVIGRSVETGPVDFTVRSRGSIEADAAGVAEKVRADIDDVPQRFEIRGFLGYPDATSNVFFNFTGSENDEYFGFEILARVHMTFDDEGYPRVEPFDAVPAQVQLRRYVRPYAMTDFAEGEGTIAFAR